MNWNSLSEFLAMGGYGLYVWSAYAAAAVLMVGEPLAARRRLRAARVAAAQAQAQEGTR